MDKQAKAKYETQSQELRVQLKIWENDWAKSHNGKKPGRDDIKQNPDIAQKYKQYNKLRDVVAGKLPPPSADKDAQQRSQKRKQSETSLGAPQTPSKRPKAAHTPLKSQLHPSDLPGPSTAATPSTNRKLFPSPALPTSIGPTPQKDGVVLGLFDLLTRTPSRSNNTSVFTATTPNTHHPAASPSTGGNRRLTRTPRSISGQRILLFGAATTTPLHNRDGNSQAGGARQTPQSGRSGVSKLQFSTPAFLRRTAAPLPPVDENGEWGIAPLRLPRKPLGRGLSNMVAGLRKIEDEALDEDMDALREMEMEMEMERLAPVKKAAPPAAAPVVRKPGAVPKDEVEVGDSQLQALLEAEAEEDGGLEPGVEPEPEPEPEPEVLRSEKPVLLGGFDDENLYDSSEAEQLDRGQPLRVYVKKGQKRTTRRSNMKPARLRRPVDVPGDDDDDEVVPETQFDPTKPVATEEDDLLDDLLSGSDFEGGFLIDEEEGEGTKKKAAAAKAKVAKAKAAEKAKKAKGKEKENGGETEEKEGIVKKAVRMVKATAHGNFKRLKLRNRGPKGGPGYGSKFRRKR
ncbi:DNA replication/checkpoint protein [Lasiosphaeris hirsuta]|uniref:DNA replication regulator SLD2 n=1 Tax=Lasiosphaeris hirsuta TaxID=260670 RepID=A0AA40B0Q9_9PEZI|nr:DNA replication/checkpoint protein [Lasiosphaeris hirsuta]